MNRVQVIELDRVKESRYRRERKRGISGLSLRTRYDLLPRGYTPRSSLASSSIVSPAHHVVTHVMCLRQMPEVHMLRHFI